MTHADATLSFFSSFLWSMVFRCYGGILNCTACAICCIYASLYLYLYIYIYAIFILIYLYL